MIKLETKTATSAVAVALTIVSLVLIYLIFKLIDFAVWPFATLWIVPPGLALFVFLLVANWETEGSVREVATSYTKNRSNGTVLALLLTAFIAWGLARSIATWAVGTDFIDHGPCGRWMGSETICGLEDLNGPARSGLTDLIDKFASAFFILCPFTILHPKVRSLIAPK